MLADSQLFSDRSRYMYFRADNSCVHVSSCAPSARYAHPYDLTQTTTANIRFFVVDCVIYYEMSHVNLSHAVSYPTPTSFAQTIKIALLTQLQSLETHTLVQHIEAL